MTEHTHGPWHWRRAENGQGSQELSLVSSADEWVKCDYYCSGWPPEGSEASRGPLGTPGHEHNRAPTVLAADGWYGSGDLTIDPDSADAHLIAAAPRMYDYLTVLASGGDNEAHAIISEITGS